MKQTSSAALLVLSALVLVVFAVGSARCHNNLTAGSETDPDEYYVSSPIPVEDEEDEPEEGALEFEFEGRHLWIPYYDSSVSEITDARRQFELHFMEKFRALTYETAYAALYQGKLFGLFPYLLKSIKMLVVARCDYLDLDEASLVPPLTLDFNQNIHAAWANAMQKGDEVWRSGQQGGKREVKATKDQIIRFINEIDKLWEMAIEVVSRSPVGAYMDWLNWHIDGEKLEDYGYPFVLFCRRNGFNTVLALADRIVNVVKNMDWQSTSTPKHMGVSLKLVEKFIQCTYKDEEGKVVREVGMSQLAKENERKLARIESWRQPSVSRSAHGGRADASAASDASIRGGSHRAAKANANSKAYIRQRGSGGPAAVEANAKSKAYLNELESLKAKAKADSKVSIGHGDGPEAEANAASRAYLKHYGGPKAKANSESKIFMGHERPVQEADADPRTHFEHYGGLKTKANSKSKIFMGHEGPMQEADADSRAHLKHHGGPKAKANSESKIFMGHEGPMQEADTDSRAYLKHYGGPKAKANSESKIFMGHERPVQEANADSRAYLKYGDSKAKAKADSKASIKHGGPGTKADSGSRAYIKQGSPALEANAGTEASIHDGGPAPEANADSRAHLKHGDLKAKAKTASKAHTRTDGQAESTSKGKLAWDSNTKAKSRASAVGDNVKSNVNVKCDEHGSSISSSSSAESSGRSC